MSDPLVIALNERTGIAYRRLLDGHWYVLAPQGRPLPGTDLAELRPLVRRLPDSHVCPPYELLDDSEATTRLTAENTRLAAALRAERGRNGRLSHTVGHLRDRVARLTLQIKSWQAAEEAKARALDAWDTAALADTSAEEPHADPTFEHPWSLQGAPSTVLAQSDRLIELAGIPGSAISQATTEYLLDTAAALRTERVESLAQLYHQDHFFGGYGHVCGKCYRRANAAADVLSPLSAAAVSR